MQGRERKGEEQEQEVCGQPCQGALSQAQTKEPNQRKWEVTGKGQAPGHLLRHWLGPPLWFFFLSVSVLNLKKNVTLKKTREYLRTFLCIYAFFQRNACFLPHPSQYLSPVNEEA